MVAESVEEAVGVGGDARRGEGYEGAEGGGLTFERELVEEAAVDVGMHGGVVFEEVASGFDVYYFRGRLDFDGHV